MFTLEMRVEAVSLLHSHKIEAEKLNGEPATIIRRRFKHGIANGEHNFICLPLWCRKMTRTTAVRTVPFGHRGSRRCKSSRIIRMTWTPLRNWWQRWRSARRGFTRKRRARGVAGERQTAPPGRGRPMCLAARSLTCRP